MSTHKFALLTLTVIGLAVLCIACEVRAQGDVPETAQHEIARRGSHVEMTGTIRSGLMAMALSPPADDSAKWFLTLIVKPGDPACERQRSTIASDPALRPWIDAREPSRSTLHYHVRSIDDQTQADWLSGLRPAIARNGLPLLVLQPPKSGQFGESKTIVKLIGGEVTGETLAARLREAIVTYVQTIRLETGDWRPEDKRTSYSLQPTASGRLETGDRRPEDKRPFLQPPASSLQPTASGLSEGVIGVPPPFDGRPKDPPNVAPLVPFDWPPSPPSPPANPLVPATDLTSLWLALSALVIYVAGWVSARVKTSLSAKAAAFARVIAILNQPPPSVPPAP